MKKIEIKEKFHNHLMKNGNKFTCEKNLLKSIKQHQKSAKKDHKKTFKQAIVNTSPAIRLCQINLKKKKKKNLREFPYVLDQKNRISICMKEISKKKLNPIKDSLYSELVSFSNKTNVTTKNFETEQKLALTKQKFAFFRWFF